MSQFAEIKTAQDNLEECFSKRMADLEAQLHAGGPAKDTVAKVAEEFRTFRELMFAMLSLLRQQINECSRTIDAIETRHRRKALIFRGVQETDKEDCKILALNVIHKMQLTNITTSDVTVCHRIGARETGKAQHRPILVRFTNMEHRSAVWKAKSKLKGSSASVREFLTKSRQVVFAKARQHFGMRSCWTQDGVVHVLIKGSRHKITAMDELNILIRQYPKAANHTSQSTTTAIGSTDASDMFAKPRK